MMHHQTDSLAVGIGVQAGQVKIRIRGHEIEHIVLLVAVPVFPAFVPSLDEQGVKPVLRSEIDIAPHICVVGSVLSMWRNTPVVCFSQPHGRQFVGVGPLARSRNHFPPYPHILDRMDPLRIFQDARVVKVQDEAGGKDIRRASAYLDRPPGAMAGGLQPPLHPFGIRSQPDPEHERPVIQVQIGRRKVHHRRFMQVHIQTVRRFHLKRSLHTGRGKALLGGVAQAHFLGDAPDFRQPGLRIIVFLRIIVSADPPGRVVARHGKFRQLLPNLEVCQRIFLREFVTETESVVVQAETDAHDGSSLLGESHQQLIVVVPDFGFLAPDRLPGLILRVKRRIHQGESAGKVFLPDQVESQPGREHYGSAVPLEGIFRHAPDHGEFQRQAAVGTVERQGFGRHLRRLLSAGKEGKGAEARRENRFQSVHTLFLSIA